MMKSECFSIKFTGEYVFSHKRTKSHLWLLWRETLSQEVVSILCMCFTHEASMVRPSCAAESNCARGLSLGCGGPGLLCSLHLFEAIDLGQVSVW